MPDLGKGCDSVITFPYVFAFYHFASFEGLIFAIDN